ncbi:MAG: hydroxymethylglutaryl-CoA synthase [Oligoflexia bacterium]|nr:hydroxymethylglutaryl-CoA synthase [Oligoflexia bacterium]
MTKTLGIVGWGSYVPRYRIKVEEIAKVWGLDADTYKRGLMLGEKAVPGPDQDTITMSIEAARNALKRAKVDPQKIDALYIGSESHPYAVKPSGTVVAEAIGAVPNIHISDLEFACKAGAESMYIAYSHVKSGEARYAVGIGADTSQGAPGDALEFSAAAGAAAYIMGSGDDEVIATIDYTHSYTSDTPDFWRREYMHYPRHGGRFTGEPAYFTHSLGAAKAIMEKSKMEAKDFTYAIFHQPNGKFPQRVAHMLGFTDKQIEPGWLSPRLGNTYSGASPLGLAATLDVAKAGDRILMVSYGSGAGSDSFIYTVTKNIEKIRNLAPSTSDYLDKNKVYIDYGTYVKFRKKIRKNDE